MANALCLLLFAASAAAAGIDYSPGSLLFGEDVTQRFDSQFSFDRLNFSCNSKKVATEGSASDGASYIRDWRPFHTNFRLSAGVLYQQQNLGFECKGQKFFEFTDLARDARLQKAISDFKPYLGIGWNGSWLQRERLGLNLDLGFAYGSDIDERLPQGAYRPWRFDPSEHNYLRDLERLELHPVFSVGVSYTF